jgi:hypothetical protein
LVIVALVLLCARAAKWRAAATLCLSAAAAVVLSYHPAVLISRSFPFPGPASTSCPSPHAVSGWSWFFTFSQVRGADWGSVWLALQNALGHPLDDHLGCTTAPTRLNLASGGLVLVVVVMVGVLVARAPRRPRVAQVAFLLVAGFVMFNKIDSPQYALWLLPLAVLARPRWASLLGWQVSEVVLGVMNFYAIIPFSGNSNNDGIGLSTYLWFVLLRDVVLLGLMVAVGREMWQPWRDVVRRDGIDDPAGGVLDGSPDRLMLGSRMVPAGVE